MLIYVRFQAIFSALGMCCFIEFCHRRILFFIYSAMFLRHACDKGASNKNANSATGKAMNYGKGNK